MKVVLLLALCVVSIAAMPSIDKQNKEQKLDAVALQVHFESFISEYSIENFTKLITRK